MSAQAGLRQIVILGGGTAGWMTAAALARALEGRIAIRVVESDAIGTIGVGESTIPMIRKFNAALGIDEDEFVRATGATFKLGIEFRDWGRIGERYMHGFGRLGQDLATLPFYQYWLRMRHAGSDLDLASFSINQAAARAHRFMRADTSHGNSPLAEITHAFHLDAGLYARYLRTYSERLGVVRTEGRVAETLLTPENGHVAALRLDSGEVVQGDLFIDCSGMRAVLIGDAMDVPFEAWDHWLPCDRAWAVPCARAAELPPYTIATARPAGWQWRIGLQHRTGNGHVYASRFMDDDAARTILLNNLDGEPLDQPRQLRFQAGRRERTWVKNVVAIGLSGGFLEPLESTSIHMIQTAIARLLDFFPDTAFEQKDIDAFNREGRFEAERIRDFLILHYHATARNDTPFWDYVRTMPVPDTLQAKIGLYRSRGRILRDANELFAEVAWLQVLEGQGIGAGGYHALAALRDESEIAGYLAEIASVIQQCAEVMPAHAQFVDAIAKMQRSAT
jgi:tryptophan halogenase